ncbi:MAG TPA: hypothetical protein VGG27_13270 [Magnetospirillaceae bacterium]|jgi:hypothetical protein
MVVRRLLSALAVVLALTSGVGIATAQQLFVSEQQAQQHCPADIVVWVNTVTSVYHFKGQRWYAATKQGAFVCKSEADRAHMRATKNGQ